jgi:hypothetical protein
VVLGLPAVCWRELRAPFEPNGCCDLRERLPLTCGDRLLNLGICASDALGDVQDEPRECIDIGERAFLFDDRDPLADVLECMDSRVVDRAKARALDMRFVLNDCVEQLIFGFPGPVGAGNLGAVEPA